MRYFAVLKPDGSLGSDVVPEFVRISSADIPLEDRYHADFISSLSQVDPNNLPTSAPSVAAVPASVSRFQARAALYLAGHFQAVEDFMSLPETPMLMRLAWQDAQSFERASPTVTALAEELGLSDADVDALFTSAAAIIA